jgi:hypothetical protein
MSEAFMKVLVDTNIFVAGMRFSGVKRKLVWKLLEEGHPVVLADFKEKAKARKARSLHQEHEDATGALL